MFVYPIPTFLSFEKENISYKSSSSNKKVQ